MALLRLNRFQPNIGTRIRTILEYLYNEHIIDRSTEAYNNSYYSKVWDVEIVSQR